MNQSRHNVEMKYGDSLPQRSIPEWAACRFTGLSLLIEALTYMIPDNVDYNEIKRLIKARTTDAEAQAISISGSQDKSEALKELEDELYVELVEQHQRIALFVRSKSGEIKRRLSSLLNTRFGLSTSLTSHCLRSSLPADCPAQRT